MSALKPVAFDRRPEPTPRVSTPYVPGKRDKRFWTADEDAVLRAHFEAGGAAACLAHLGEHRTASSVYVRAGVLGLKSNGTGPRTRHRFTAELDETIRREWALLNGNKRGEVADLAARLGLQRHVLSKRARNLQLVMPHRKEPVWTAAEDALMAKVPLADPKRCARIFAEHGFRRSETAIVVRAKRLNLSRRNSRETMSATAAAKIFGIDVKAITALCISGDLPATKRDDKRSPQQGGSAWDIRPADLRLYVVRHLERIDFRKVDKFALVHLLTAEDPRYGGEAAE